MEYEIHRLDVGDDQALSACFGVFSFLRPHLSESRFFEQVRVQSSEGYKVAYIEQEGEVIAAAGYRTATFLAWGRMLYIDDLITHPNKERGGLGGTLLDWLLAEGKRLGCEEAHLDTGHLRHDAHRLYLKKGFVLSCHHMSMELK